MALSLIPGHNLTQGRRKVSFGRTGERMPVTSGDIFEEVHPGLSTGMGSVEISAPTSPVRGSVAVDREDIRFAHYARHTLVVTPQGSHSFPVNSRI